MTVFGDDLDRALVSLVAQSPPALLGEVALLRSVCAGALSLPALPAETVAEQRNVDDTAALVEFAEQFSTDVSGVTARQRAALAAALGEATFPVVVQCYLADFLPRVAAGLTALGLPVPWVPAPRWDPAADAAGILFTEVLPGVARLRAVDPVTTEVVRLRGAVAHNCRLCRSLREGGALDAGGSETLYDDIARYETSTLLSDAHKTALRWADALIWTPSRIDADIVGQVRRHFSAEQARELTLDVMRNASNKIAVALAADEPHVAEGTERYLIDEDGQTVFTSR